MLYFNTWVGGGWGDPFARDPQLVLQDVKRRLVTVEGAKRYGVIIIAADGSLDADGSVDMPATERLRAELRAAAGEPTLFNFGGDLEDIRHRCEAETHLPAPVKPTFMGRTQ
jgi:N-methylhydantoinase B